MSEVDQASQDDEVEYLSGPRYWMAAMAPSDPVGWAVLAFVTAVIVIAAVSLIKLTTKEVPEVPPQVSTGPVLEESFSGRQAESQESLYRARSALWAAQTRELALAFHDDRWEGRLDSLLPDHLVDQVRGSDWPIGTEPLISDYGKDGDSQGYSKISFREGWSLYLVVELQPDQSFDIIGVEFDRGTSE